MTVIGPTPHAHPGRSRSDVFGRADHVRGRHGCDENLAPAGLGFMDTIRCSCLITDRRWRLLCELALTRFA
jgi:hypothetical protein